jgi:hypothetical protein
MLTIYGTRENTYIHDRADKYIPHWPRGAASARLAGQL